MQALITKRNNPSEKTVAGNVNRINNGFINASSNDRIMATIKAENISFISTPSGIIYAIIKALTAHTNILKHHFSIP